MKTIETGQVKLAGVSYTYMATTDYELLLAYVHQLECDLQRSECDFEELAKDSGLQLEARAAKSLVK